MLNTCRYWYIMEATYNTEPYVFHLTRREGEDELYDKYNCSETGEPYLCTTHNNYLKILLGRSINEDGRFPEDTIYPDRESADRNDRKRIY